MVPKGYIGPLLGYLRLTKGLLRFSKGFLEDAYSNKVFNLGATSIT
jgi:hypothetical protein